MKKKTYKKKAKKQISHRDSRLGGMLASSPFITITNLVSRVRAGEGEGASALAISGKVAYSARVKALEK